MKANNERVLGAARHPIYGTAIDQMLPTARMAQLVSEALSQSNGMKSLQVISKTFAESIAPTNYAELFEQLEKLDGPGFPEVALI